MQDASTKKICLFAYETAKEATIINKKELYFIVLLYADSCLLWENQIP